MFVNEPVMKITFIVTNIIFILFTGGKQGHPRIINLLATMFLRYTKYRLNFAYACTNITITTIKRTVLPLRSLHNRGIQIQSHYRKVCTW
jgi:hypothetical protein